MIVGTVKKALPVVVLVVLALAGVVSALGMSAFAATPRGSAGLFTTTTTSTVDVGVPVLLGKRTKTSGCLLGANADGHCSPGAYSSKLTMAVICASSFRTGPIRNVSTTEKHMVEVEYGMAPASYGSSLEIDHIVSLELGGSNNIANL